MARTDTLNNFLTDVAGAIKEKKGSSTSIPAANFDTEIRNLPSQGTYEEKSVTITQNGTQNVVPDSGYDALSRVSITTAVPEKQLQTKSVTIQNNGTSILNPDTGYDGFSQVTLDVSVSGGGGSGDVKKFPSQQAMQADPSPTLGDLAIVYDNSVSNWTQSTQSDVLIFPSTVVLTEAFSDYIDAYFNAVDSSEHYFMGQVTLTSQYFEFRAQYEGGYETIYYETQDGMTYTLGDCPSSLNVGYAVECSYGWNNILGNFIQTGSVVFDGIFEYDGSEYVYADLPLSTLTVGDLYDEITAYGKNGIVTGDGSIWNRMSAANKLRTFYGASNIVSDADDNFSGVDGMGTINIKNSAVVPFQASDRTVQFIKVKNTYSASSSTLCMGTPINDQPANSYTYLSYNQDYYFGYNSTTKKIFIQDLSYNTLAEVSVANLGSLDPSCIKMYNDLVIWPTCYDNNGTRTFTFYKLNLTSKTITTLTKSFTINKTDTKDYCFLYDKDTNKYVFYYKGQVNSNESFVTYKMYITDVSTFSSFTEVYSAQTVAASSGIWYYGGIIEMIGSTSTVFMCNKISNNDLTYDVIKYDLSTNTKTLNKRITAPSSLSISPQARRMIMNPATFEDSNYIYISRNARYVKSNETLEVINPNIFDGTGLVHYCALDKSLLYSSYSWYFVYNPDITTLTPLYYIMVPSCSLTKFGTYGYTNGTIMEGCIKKDGKIYDYANNDGSRTGFWRIVENIEISDITDYDYMLVPCANDNKYIANAYLKMMNPERISTLVDFEDIGTISPAETTQAEEQISDLFGEEEEE